MIALTILKWVGLALGAIVVLGLVFGVITMTKEVIIMNIKGAREAKAAATDEMTDGDNEA